MKDFSDRAAELALSEKAPAGAAAKHGFPTLTPSLPLSGRSVLPASEAANNINRPTFYRRWGKRIFDLTLLVLTLPLTLPLMVLAVVMLATERKPIFYWQKRVGQNGRVFDMLKLRTMVPGADQVLEDYLAKDPALRDEWNSTQKLKNDPRITKVGAFLRKTSLDELPQLWNVARGEMSLVGPRPMMPSQTGMYGNMRAYVAMRPGITGLWQVTDRNESDFAARIIADRKYARFCSLKLDVTLMVKTVGVVLRGTGY